jgi:tartrate dehydratase beta subunit/fumarate hydratase class I family protein
MPTRSPAFWRIEVEDFPAFVVVDKGQRVLREARRREHRRRLGV